MIVGVTVASVTAPEAPVAIKDAVAEVTVLESVALVATVLTAVGELTVVVVAGVSVPALAAEVAGCPEDRGRLVAERVAETSVPATTAADEVADETVPNGRVAEVVPDWLSPDVSVAAAAVPAPVSEADVGRGRALLPRADVTRGRALLSRTDVGRGRALLKAVERPTMIPPPIEVESVLLLVEESTDAAVAVG